MSFLQQLKESKESQRILDLKRALFERYANWSITKAQYDLELERLNLDLEQEKIDRSKPTIWWVAIWIASSMVKWTVNWLFSISWSNIKPFKKK